MAVLMLAGGPILSACGGGDSGAANTIDYSATCQDEGFAAAYPETCARYGNAGQAQPADDRGGESSDVTELLACSNYPEPETRAELMANPEDVYYASPDAVSICAWYTPPDGVQPDTPLCKEDPIGQWEPADVGFGDFTPGTYFCLPPNGQRYPTGSHAGQDG